MEDKIEKRGFRHGLTGTTEYNTWKNIKARCYNPKNAKYADYGGRGIKMCDEWVNDPVAFCNFMGKKPSEEHTIERKDNNKDYSPDNCEWVTRKVQANNRRSNRLITYNGKTQNMRAWCDETGLTKSVICNRLSAGWDVEKVFTEPVLKTKPYRNLKAMTKYDLEKFVDWLKHNGYYICERETDYKDEDYWLYIPAGFTDKTIISKFLEETSKSDKST